MPTSRNVEHKLYDNVGSPASGLVTGATHETFGYDSSTCHLQTQVTAAGSPAASWDLEGRIDSNFDWVKIVTGITAAGLNKDLVMLPEMRVVQTAAGAANFQFRLSISEG